MNGLKKWMAIIMTSVTIMGNMTGQGIPVMGAEKEVQEVITSGNIYVTETGAKERVATVYKGNIIKNLIMDCQSYTKYRPNETTGGIFVSWRRKEELPTGA